MIRNYLYLMLIINCEPTKQFRLQHRSNIFNGLSIWLIGSIFLFPYFASCSMCKTLIFVQGLLAFCIQYTTSFNRLIILYGPPQLVCNLEDKRIILSNLARLQLTFILSLTIFMRVRTNFWSSFRPSPFPEYAAPFTVAGLTPNSKSSCSFIAVPKITLEGYLHIES